MADDVNMFTLPESPVSRTQVQVRMPIELRNYITDVANGQSLSVNETIIQMLSYCRNVLEKGIANAEETAEE
jgi:predicted HicB family RNase H-like nuclease